MKLFLKIISFISLALMLTTSVLVFMNVITVEMNKSFLLALTIIWFVSTPFWMLEKEQS